MASIAKSYDTRAPTYDTATSFHSHLASEYVKYANPQPGETLLDLACGTGLVTFEFAKILQSDGQKPIVVGVDLSRGMLDVAVLKLQPGQEITFVEHDICNLDGVKVLEGKEGTFDTITICSALVLLPDSAAATKHWAEYLKSGGNGKTGGRMVVDVPHTHSMLALKILDLIGPEFGIESLGRRTWIKGPESLRGLLEGAGLTAEVRVTEVFGDIPARTEQGRDEWGCDEGGDVWDRVVGRMGEWGKLEGEQRGRARRRFVEEWARLAVDEVVREEGRLFVGVGRKR